MHTKKILLPTDFSENSWNAIKYAVSLLKNEECIFYILHTYTPAIVHNRFLAKKNVGSKQSGDSQTDSENGLKKILYDIYDYSKNPRHEFKTISSFSLIVDEIKDIVLSENIDMLIMGAKGATASLDVSMGSNAVRIVKAIKNCPILIIPQHYEYKEVKDIVFATDLKRFYNEAMIEPIIETASVFDATVKILHVQVTPELSEIQQFNLNMLKRYFKEAKHKVHLVKAQEDSVSNTIENFANKFQIYLLIMLNYQHSFIETITRETKVRLDSFAINIPFMIIPELGIYKSTPQLNTTASVVVK
ncbi:universal stress protein [Aquimarina rhabdastrellae]